MAVSAGLHTEDRRIARRALNRADELLDELEQLLLHGSSDVPDWCSEDATGLRREAIKAGLRDPRLETRAGVIKLMDDVYTLEERLMRRLCRRPVQRVVDVVSA